MTWTLSISCLSSVVENEENLFERFDKNAPERVPQVHELKAPANRPSFCLLSVKTDSSPRPEVRIWKSESTTTKE
jgi:hypothetical protein